MSFSPTQRHRNPQNDDVDNACGSNSLSKADAIISFLHQTSELISQLVAGTKQKTRKHTHENGTQKCAHDVDDNDNDEFWTNTLNQRRFAHERRQMRRVRRFAHHIVSNDDSARHRSVCADKAYASSLAAQLVGLPKCIRDVGVFSVDLGATFVHMEFSPRRWRFRGYCAAVVVRLLCRMYEVHAVLA